ncbi:formyltransferase family protein [Spiribacter vilamensis]|uniref:formyltransferase family protein n=1 Tax=Spiribacter vilamensis TaxID=531306 RepID=UPI00102C23ED|nr:formyltransferase family protein [Spiribacter vilamensis]TVO61890.1 hypothetical protein FPL09_07230 [Spiribacter vilamensis]
MTCKKDIIELFDLRKEVRNEQIDNATLSRVCSRIDVHGVLYNEYTDDKLTVGNAETGLLKQSDLAALARIILVRVHTIEQFSLKAKLINTLLKLQDGRMGEFGFQAENSLEELIESVRMPPSSFDDSAKVSLVEEVREEIKEKDTNAVLIFHPGVAALKYLALMKAFKCQPRRIIVLSNSTSPKQQLKKVLRKLSASKQNKFIKNELDLRPQDCFHADTVLAASSIRDCFDSEVDYLKVKQGINDPKLAELVAASTEDIAIFSGGGILKNSFISSANKKLLHMHPGWLPSVRGADGLFWSTLDAGSPAVTSFYMNAGIDTGDIVHRSYYPAPSFPADIDHFSYGEVYRSLLQTFDPWLRAKSLTKVIQKAESLGTRPSCLPAILQNSHEGHSFHFMHPKLRDHVVKLMISRGRRQEQ